MRLWIQHGTKSRRRITVSRYGSVLFIALLTIALAACGTGDAGGAATATTSADRAPTSAAQSDAGRITVVATTTQIGALVQEVAGDQVDLHTLMAPGVDAHDFEVTPADIRGMSEAHLILRNGVGLDDFLDDSIEAAGGDAAVVTVTDGIELIEGGHALNAGEDEHAQDEEADEHGEYDPHVWHDPANAKVMVDNITAALAAADASRAATFVDNAEAYKQVLDETDAEIRAMFAEIPPENRKLVTNHDAFGYFIKAYDLEFVGAVIPSTSSDAEPSAQQIAELSELIGREHVRAIFAESSLDPRVAEQLAGDTGVEIVYGLYSDSLGEPGSDAATVHGMLLANAAAISEALK